MTTVGIIGAGEVGSQLARALIAIGYEVVIANSRGPETLQALIRELGPSARAATAAAAGRPSFDVPVAWWPCHGGAGRGRPLRPGGARRPTTRTSR